MLNSSHNTLSALQVLIVDDEKLMHKLVCNVLTSLGFRDITTANSGRQAMGLVTQKRFDFIITDWRMGDLDGIDVVHFIRTSPDAQNPTMPIIMLTGNTEARYVITALNAGINGYVIKPFSAEQLVRRIRAVIENPRQYVLSPHYRGPDRRHNDLPPPGGIERRKKPSTYKK